jgi:hypothetical protein
MPERLAAPHAKSGLGYAAAMQCSAANAMHCQGCHRSVAALHVWTDWFDAKECDAGPAVSSQLRQDDGGVLFDGSGFSTFSTMGGRGRATDSRLVRFSL